MVNFKHKVVAIILSYLRPQNIQRICDTILELDEVSQIVISNNNPDIDIKDFLKLNDKRVKLVEQNTKTGPIKRFEIAESINSDFFFSIDDDLFLTKNQIEYLILQLIENPLAPHGFWGQNFVEKQNQVLFEYGIINKEIQVDILNRAYFFTQQHNEELINLVKLTDINTVGPCDDIYLSFSGRTRPFSHDIGRYEDCPTSNEKGIAQWKDLDFDKERVNVLKKILNLKQTRH